MPFNSYAECNAANESPSSSVEPVVFIHSIYSKTHLHTRTVVNFRRFSHNWKLPFIFLRSSEIENLLKATTKSMHVLNFRRACAVVGDWCFSVIVDFLGTFSMVYSQNVKSFFWNIEIFTVFDDFFQEIFHKILTNSTFSLPTNFKVELDPPLGQSDLWHNTPPSSSLSMCIAHRVRIVLLSKRSCCRFLHVYLAICVAVFRILIFVGCSLRCACVLVLYGFWYCHFQSVCLEEKKNQTEKVSIWTKWMWIDIAILKSVGLMNSTRYAEPVRLSVSRTPNSHTVCGTQ